MSFIDVRAEEHELQTAQEVVLKAILMTPKGNIGRMWPDEFLAKLQAVKDSGRIPPEWAEVRVFYDSRDGMFWGAIDGYPEHKIAVKKADLHTENPEITYAWMVLLPKVFSPTFFALRRENTGWNLLYYS